MSSSSPGGRWPRLARRFRPYLAWAALAALLGVAAAAAGAAEPLFYRSLTDLLVASVGQRARAAAAWHTALPLLAGLAALWLGERLLQSGQAVAAHRVRFDSSFDLSQQVLRQLFTRPLSFHQHSSAGYALTRVDRGVAALGQMVAELLQTLVPQSVSLALLAGLLCSLSPRLAAIALAPLPLYLWATLAGAAQARRQEAAVQEGWSRIYGRVAEVLHGIKTVQSLGGEEHELAAYRHGAQAVFRNLWRLVWLDQGYGQAQNALALAGRLAVAADGFQLVLGGRISPGTWIAATSYAALLYGPLAQLAAAFGNAARQSAAAGAALAFLAEADAAPPPAAAAPVLPRLQGAVVFDGVSFAYPAAASTPPRWALQEVSFTIAAGEIVALTGASGGGKTTLTDLLLRFHYPAAGRILLDGRDLRTIAPAALRRHLAVVLQDPLLLAGSVADNVAYGRPGASTAQIWRALRLAQAEEFVAGLPQGLQTQLGEGGARLSGGERQRLALARALLRDPRILILDEATAHLDPAQRAALHRGLRQCAGVRTVIAISHHDLGALAPDRTLVLRHGRLAAAAAAAH